MAVRLFLAVLLLTLAPSLVRAQAAAQLPTLAQPVNDFAHVIDAASADQLDRMIRELRQVTGDAVVVATVPSIEPYADIRDYAVKLFENGGQGVGDRGKDNGLLILLAPNVRRVWVEVGYGLEEWITDGYAGQVSRDDMTPEFRKGNFGTGLVAGTSRIIGRIAQGRGVQLTGVRVPQATRPLGTGISLRTIVLAMIVIWVLSRMGGGRGGSNLTIHNVEPRHP
ncbi:MAG: TPM domain-containing protein [Vicinamibacterales bacterium]